MTTAPLPSKLLTLAAACALALLPATAPAAGTVEPQAAGYRVLAVNDLGMHCYDADFSVFSILPLFNNLRAQVIRTGPTPAVLGDTSAALRYRARRDPAGSINRTSRGKTNFWDYVAPLYGVDVPADTGLLGAKMPGPRNRTRRFTGFDAAASIFTVTGIPITVWDDAGKRNPYSLFKVKAKAPGTGESLASASAVVPASDEMDCGECHQTGADAASDPGITWSVDPDPDRRYKENILLLHDDRQGTSLNASRPVLCFTCHYSPALDLAGTGPGPQQTGQPYLSRAVHTFHATRMDTDPSGTATCFSCHPGRVTQCLRGIMSLKGIGCLDCHGTMTAVGLDTRMPWADEPKCQSCHTGDALDNLGGDIVRTTAYDGDPDVAEPLLAPNPRFAENPGTLYRLSTGHGGVGCAMCHGSPHAEWPSRERNDNLAAIRLQRHKGTIIECTACHGPGGAPLGLDGPHGLHPVGQQWVNGHESIAEGSLGPCSACHGLLGGGTILSRAAVDRVYAVEDGGTVRVYGGTRIGCGLCHGNPFLGGGD